MMTATRTRPRGFWLARLRCLWLLLSSPAWLAWARSGVGAAGSAQGAADNVHLVLGVSTGHVATRSLSGEDPALRVLRHVEFALEEWYPFPPPLKKRRSRFPDAKFPAVEYPRSPAQAMAYAYNSTWTLEDQTAYFESVVVPKVTSILNKSHRRDTKSIFADLGHTNVAFMNGAAHAMVHHGARMRDLGVGHVSFVRIRRSRYHAALSLAADGRVTTWDHKGWPGWDLCRSLAYRLCPYEMPDTYVLRMPPTGTLSSAAAGSDSSAASARAWFTGDHMCDHANDNCACDWDGGDCRHCRRSGGRECDREAECLRPPQHSCNAVDDDPDSLYRRWRSLSRFQQALYMMDETEARWQRLVDTYGGGSGTTSAAATAASESPAAVSFHSLNWSGGGVPGAASALAAFLNGKATAGSGAARGGGGGGGSEAHASSQTKRTFSVADAQALDRQYRHALGFTRGHAQPFFAQQVATLATDREQVLFQSAEYDHGLGPAVAGAADPQ